MTKRGDLVTVSLSGDYGKPRPALVIQNDLLEELDSVVLCPVTSDNPTLSHVSAMLAVIAAYIGVQIDTKVKQKKHLPDPHGIA